MDNPNIRLENELATLEMLKHELEGLQKHMEMLEMTKQEYKRARKTLGDYKNLKDDEILIPLGAGALIHANVSKKKKVIMNIGSDLNLEVDFEEAVKIIDDRFKELESAEKNVKKTSEDIQQQYVRLSSKMEREYAQFMTNRGIE